MVNGPAGQVFRVGEEVVLARGTYQGALGVFVRLKEDVNWAEITERNGSIRSHPVAWLDHSKGSTGGETTKDAER